MLGIIKKAIVFVVILCATALWADSALATQTHDEPEGLYSHLIAHGVFFLAMAYLSFRLIRSGEFRQKGWNSIFISAFLFALWNVDTFFVHVYQEIIDPFVFSGDLYGLSSTFHAQSFVDLLFYLGRLDHLFSLPALLFLFLGIRTLLKHHEDRAWT
jgi:hypothetical protein